MAKPAIQCEGLTKRFDGAVAVDDVTLEVGEGETLALLGPSACGKTTLLRLIAGFERPDGGSVSIHGKIVVDADRWIPPEKRRIGFVFQDYALFPHLTVAANVAFGLKGRTGRRERVEAMLHLVGLDTTGQRMPDELSGGQQQRVALARALAPDPDLVLLDEPFSNLDADLRRHVREDLSRILRQTGATAIFVTHDQEEALNLGTKVAIMRKGRILDVEDPREIYLNPKCRETAEIVGRVNLLPGESTGREVRCALGVLPLARPSSPGATQVLVRPEAMTLAPGAYSSDHGGAGATVLDLQFHGNHQHALIELDAGHQLRVRICPTHQYRIGQRVLVSANQPVVALDGDSSQPAA